MYKALISFSGLVTMAKGEIKELKDEGIIKDLLRAGYIEEVKKDTEKIIKNEIKKDVEKIVEVVEKEVKKVTTKKNKTKSK